MYAGILLAILGPLLWIYRRDTSELPWYLRVSACRSCGRWC